MNRAVLFLLPAVSALLLAGCDGHPAPSGGDPDRPAAHDHAEHAASAYQCPMHPEVTSDRPGSCPICGMRLVPVEAPATTALPAHDHAEHAASAYQCPMHPEVTSDRPGSCPICGMDLVAVQAAGPARSSDEGSMQLSAAMVNNLGVRTVPVRHGELGGQVDTVGTVAYDDRGKVEVRVRADGYVERLAVRAEGEVVRRGQALFAVFSPRLEAAQREYLAALGLAEPALVEAAAGRLRALGLDAGAVARLKDSGQPAGRVTYYSPMNGVVTVLGVREGGLAEPGMSAMTLAPFDQLWVVADVPEAEAARVTAGASATLRFAALPGQQFEGQVLEVLPQLDTATRSLQARIPLQNPGGRLSAGMLADVVIEGSGAGHGLLIPQEALIRTGRAERVMVALGDGRFVAREVRAGAESGDDIEILDGLVDGEQVVVAGQFMLDSESQVRSSLRRYGDASAGDAGGHEGHGP